MYKNKLRIQELNKICLIQLEKKIEHAVSWASMLARSFKAEAVFCLVRT